ncbi:hypothetical protein [uncultured Shewanella sp.]|uniref:hypothetical protein n=1 Tax=uncultured Shewanella sp. TaxID=173975 RepID=UPI00260E4D94|nr:hypothetical protein [uncultured Shewanella sp.]
MKAILESLYKIISLPLANLLTTVAILALTLAIALVLALLGLSSTIFNTFQQ